MHAQGELPSHLTHAGAPALGAWEYAGLLLTYWCNARCAFCYVYSGPDRGGEMTRELALRLWATLDQHAKRHGRRMRIHLAGGEPMGDWPRLAALVRAARDAGLTPLEKIETNAFWAVDDDLTRTRLELLDALGMEKLVVSADIYHQEFVPIERVRRCVEIARRVLGAGRVRVRWWDFYNRPDSPRGLAADAKNAAYATALERHRDRMTGRAALRLAPLLEQHDAEHFAGRRCVDEVLQSRHVHIDGHGNIFPGVCSGIILARATDRGVDEAWDDLSKHWRENPVVDAVVEGGSYELMRRAEGLGYRRLPGGYANKCHLCTDVRQFLFDHGLWRAAVGPAECYANERDRREAALPLPVLAAASAAS
ncbi:MAG: radical SAM protein [Phycisphaerae bacterium]